MKKLAMAFAALATLATLAPQAVLADHHHKHWRDRNFRGNTFYTNTYGVRYNNNNGWHNGWRNRRGYNGMYINNGVGADGYPAWMGGYRPRYR